MNAEANLHIDRVRGADRIASLDVLRGIAILFILYMNIPGMGGYEMAIEDFRYPSWTTADFWSVYGIQTYLNGTQRGLLELLFGAGIMIMARRAMTADGPVAVADLHYRRNLWLCVLGLFNAFVLMWWGDILLTYGIAATFLFPFRRLKPLAQCGFAALLLAALLAFSVSQYRDKAERFATAARVTAAQAAHQQVSAEDKKVFDKFQERVHAVRTLPQDNPKVRKKIAEADKAHHSTFTAYWLAQFGNWQFLMSWFWIIEAEILATMLLGMAFYQWGVIQGRAKRSVYWGLMLGGYALGLGLRGTLWWQILKFNPALHWQGIFGDFDRLAVTFGHLGLIHLVLGSAIGRRLLRPFEAAGRMPLTIYLFTSLLMMWLVFAPWGLGLWGHWGQAQMLGVASIVIIAEVIAANLWMRAFDNGPMEWLWKSLAYQRREPFRKTRDPSPGAIPSPI
jgi:uncharacterized protein